MVSELAFEDTPNIVVLEDLFSLQRKFEYFVAFHKVTWMIAVTFRLIDPFIAILQNFLQIDQEAFLNFPLLTFAPYAAIVSKIIPK